ncbi:MAG TPA: substrate-binding domain-containing protein [Dongiaceae bacterium]|nr:substrate-binding domain-containing protein [Dongiaceae bacterium]
MTTGVCRNAACDDARAAKPVELYPGPGAYCPACGDALEPVAPEPVTSEPVAAAPFGGLSALEALAQFDPGETPADEAPPAPRSPARKRAVLVAASVAVAGLAAFAVLRPTAAHRSVVANAVRVCSSSMTERLAADVVRAYAEKSGAPRARFALTHGAACDVRFAARRSAKGTAVVGHDGIVVVVNPANPLARMSEDDIRLIFSGAITDWAEFGEAPGRIVAVMPAAASDEAETLARTLLAHSGIGAGVRRVASSADVVRAVVSPAGRGSIGLVAFSAAVPAKVLALAPHPAPSFLSIGDQRYALTVAVTVDSASRAAGAAALTAYAKSRDAQALVLRAGFVPKEGT